MIAHALPTGKVWNKVHNAFRKMLKVFGDFQLYSSNGTHSVGFLSHRKTFWINQTCLGKLHHRQYYQIRQCKVSRTYTRKRMRNLIQKNTKTKILVSNCKTYIFWWPLVPTLPISFSITFPFDIPLSFHFTFPVLLLNRWQWNWLNVTFFSIVIRRRMCNWWCCGRPWLQFCWIKMLKLLTPNSIIPSLLVTWFSL